MDSLADLPRRYDAERWRRGFDALPRFGDRGLTLGRGTVLARMEAGTICLDGDRLAALLLVAHGRAVPLSVVKHARRAAKYWRRGEAALAHIELAFARLPRLQAEDDAFSLFLSELLLDDGLAPHDLAQALGVVLAKYDPDQPRVPAGNGRESGRWGPGSGADGAGAAGTARVAEMTPVVARSFLADASPSVVRALTAFAARFTVPTAVLGALFIPTPNDGGVTEGTLPGAPDVRFRLDGPAGLLRLARTLPDGSEAAAGRHRRAAALPRADNRHGSWRERSREGLRGRRARPRQPDRTHPARLRGQVLDPKTGKYVFFDDCFRYAGDLVDGDMRAGDLVEAKGLRREYLYQHSQWSTAMKDDVDQAERELRAAKARGVGLKWYYAESGAADMARKRFERAGLDGITVGFMPPRRR